MSEHSSGEFMSLRQAARLAVRSLASLASLVSLAALAVFCMGIIAAPQAGAQTPSASGREALYTQSLAATCANCHGTNGKAVDGSSVTSIAGLDKTYFSAQMKAFKTGTRPATVMHQISKGYSDAQIETLAAWFAAQKK
jgi:cytochrome subunit of sulfide dehydrogenase